MTSKINYKFYLRTDQVTKSGNFNIYLYFNLQGKKIYLSIGFDVPKKYWNEKEQTVKNGYRDTTLINQKINSIKSNILSLIIKSDATDKNITPDDIKNLTKKTANDNKLTSYIENQITKEFDNNNLALGTKRIYTSLLNHLKKFSPSINIDELNPEYWENLEKYFKSKGHSRNTIFERFTEFKTQINQAVKDGLIDKNPFTGMTVKKDKKRREFLILSEIETIENYRKKCTSKRDLKIVTPFLLACYTGLRFSDIYNLKWENIDKNWIDIKIKKTDTEERIPLNEPALKILSTIPKTDEKLFRLQNLTNVRLNEIVHELGINKKITFHCSRHTFATISLLLSRDIATVSKLLGHSKISTTEIYAQIIDESKLNVVNLWNKKPGT